MERVMLFIDGSNVYHGLKALLGHARMDYERFTQFLCGERKLVTAYYYNATIPEKVNPAGYKAQQDFLVHVHNVPYMKVKLGRLEQ
jgi:hypothetical protein